MTKTNFNFFYEFIEQHNCSRDKSYLKVSQNGLITNYYQYFFKKKPIIGEAVLSEGQ